MARMISYAQNGEDVLLDRLFPADHRGFYIDVGANHPTLHSVTKHFYDLGWNGVNIEPVSRVFEMLQAERPRDVNLNIGLSEREGELVFHEACDSLGMSSFSKDFVGGLKRDGYVCVERTVPVSTLAKVCETYVAGRTIDFLKIDVESHEHEVIRGGDWQRWRPRVLVIEDPHPEPGGWDPMLRAASYLLVAFDGLNRYYVRNVDRELAAKLATPVNVLDDYRSHAHVSEAQELSRALAFANAERDEARARWAEANARLAELDDLGPASLAIARRIRRVAGRFPRLASAVKRALRPAG